MSECKFWSSVLHWTAFDTGFKIEVTLLRGDIYHDHVMTMELIHFYSLALLICACFISLWLCYKVCTQQKTSVNMPYRQAYQVSLWGFLCVCFVFVSDAFDFENNCHLIHVSSLYFFLDHYLSLQSSQDTVWEVEGKRWLENGSQGMVQQTCFFIHIAFSCLKSVVL